MLSDRPIPKIIAHCFKTYNVFEIKGIHSSITINAYYKTIGYAALLFNQINEPDQYSSLDINITFLSFHYPRKLIKKLRKNVLFTIEKYSAGIYYISNETFKIQIIITQELPSEENLYLRCLTNNLQDVSMVNRLTEDFTKHLDQRIYNKYLQQLSTANLKTKGVSFMENEWIFKLFGTSSEEIITRAKQEDAVKINELSAMNEQLSSSNKQLSSQNNHLKSLLKQHNISFE